MKSAIFKRISMFLVFAVVGASAVLGSCAAAGCFTKTVETTQESANSGSSSGSTTNSGSSSGATSDSGEVVASEAIDLGVYSELTDEDGNAIDYWISNTSYMSSSSFSGGSGTSSNPYLISCAEDLAYLSYSVFIGESTYSSTYFEQTCDIDLSAHVWMAIGGHCSEGSTTSYYFRGNYDGCGHVLSGMSAFFDSSAEDLTIFSYLGVFGYSTSSGNSISNLGVENSAFVGNSNVGGICGKGVFLKISCCYSEASVSGYSDVGGIVGVMNSGTVCNCFNLGLVVASPQIAGGICGRLEGGANIVYNCYNAGSVVAYRSSAGISGIVYPTADGFVIANCFNLGAISAIRAQNTGLGAAGIMATFYGSGEVSFISNYFGGDCAEIDGLQYGSNTEGRAEYISTLKTLAQTTSWFESEGWWDSEYAWDFDLVWAISADYNGGYPYLRAFGDYGSGEEKLQYDSEGGYWFYEDGEFPQSEVVDSSLISSLTSYAVRTSEVYVISSQKFNVWTYSSEKYIFVSASGKNLTSSSSSGTWFLVEPIRWIIAYDSTGTDFPTEAEYAISALVISVGSYMSESVYDLSFTSLFNATLVNSTNAVSSGSLLLSTEDSITYDRMVSSMAQTVVYSVNLGNNDDNNETITSAGYRVASVSEIDTLSASYASTCSDLVAFFLNLSGQFSQTISGGDSIDYWTRDLAYSLDSSSYYGTSSYSGGLGQGVYVTSGGTVSNSSLYNSLGARLCVTL